MVHDLFRDPQAVETLIQKIVNAAPTEGPTHTFMEVCGTHTHSIAAAGLRKLLPNSVRLISGPGCPVCVTPVDYLDRAIALAHQSQTLVMTFGDLMRVPSSTVSLEQARAEGANVEIVYSPRDALAKARSNTNLRVVFLAVGFETTAPTSAAALAEAEAENISNFMILPGNKIMPPPMRALVEDPELKVNGFILPGHVSVIAGSDTFQFLADEYGVSGVVVGFTPADVLQGVLHLVEGSSSGVGKITNLYQRVVTPGGNPAAQAILDRFFEPADCSWRGFGVIPRSGLALRSEWQHCDATLLPADLPEPVEPTGCRCGDVLRGVIDPPECPLFGAACTPDSPVGACMVSSEGTCAAWHRHGLWRDKNNPPTGASLPGGSRP
ncbi:MAG: hydrogenase formation protein HypD [bacterium]|nr:hydrogenase formation protein HypD [bacterium]